MEKEGSAASDAPSVDVDVLKRLLGDDDEVIAQFLRSFLKVTSKQFNELAQAVTLGETQRMTELAHSLKSSARWVGAGGLGDQFAELEACRETDHAAVCSKFEDIRQQYGKVTDDIGRLLLEM